MTTSAERGLVAWFTGLSGSGKSTVATRAAGILRAKGIRVGILDGDEIRRRLDRPLGFSREDVRTSNEIVLELCERERGDVDVLFVTRVSPLEADRRAARTRLGDDLFEVYVMASLETVMRRDPKGLYARAATGAAPLIGMSGAVPYEPPADAEITLDTERYDADEAAARLATYVARRVAAAAR